jgi:hypothetical protein
MSKKSKAATEETALAARGPTELTEFDAELAAEAQKAKDTVEGIGGGLFASIRGGKLTIGDRVVPSGKIAVVIVAHTACKTYYPNGFDPKKAESPTCYAFGDKLKGMIPHAQSAKTEHHECDTCPQNAFGTARQGNGKACKDQMRIAFVEGGSIEENGVHIPLTDSKVDLGKLSASDMVKLNIPPTSLSAFAKYLKSVADLVQRPLYGVATKIEVKMGDDEYPVISFSLLGPLSAKQIQAVRPRTSSAKEDLVQPFPKMSEAPKKGAASKEAPEGAGF